MTVEPESAHLCRQSARDQAAAPKPINQSARFLDELQGGVGKPLWETTAASIVPRETEMR
ncbi:hypothetical protein EH30_09145 [Erythrobacter sp. JL475]|nr:hypothetical protein EH30_09145 [Erythrobacter sp. JL475]